jgi:NAD(P)-dependent dehydrogenase (short-subunit alcohol dehydrogenase family)
MPNTDQRSTFDPTKSFRLDGLVCAITGGANGIGRATAFAAGRSGAIIHILDHDSEGGRAVANELQAAGVTATAHTVDVADEAAVERAMQAIAGERGLDILVNDAGLAIRKPSMELSREDWQRVVDVNMTGVFLCARAAARYMIGARGGSIINLASIMSFSGGGLYPNISYQSSKGAVLNMTRALAVEWVQHNIRVNAVAPTWVRTEFIRPILNDPKLVERIYDMTPMRRIAEPDDIAAAIVFLASPAAGMITGHTLAVDGGFLAQ